ASGLSWPPPPAPTFSPCRAKRARAPCASSPTGHRSPSRTSATKTRNHRRLSAMTTTDPGEGPATDETIPAEPYDQDATPNAERGGTVSAGQHPDHTEQGPDGIEDDQTDGATDWPDPQPDPDVEPAHGDSTEDDD